MLLSRFAIQVAWGSLSISGVKAPWASSLTSSSKRYCTSNVVSHLFNYNCSIHSQRKPRLDQKLVEKLVYAHTNLVMRESLDDALRHLLSWDIELLIDEPVDTQDEEPEVQVRIVVTQTYLICWESRLVYAPIICIQHLFGVILHSLLGWNWLN